MCSNRTCAIPLLTLFRESIVRAIPANLKYAISAGIGMFIAYIGLKGPDGKTTFGVGTSHNINRAGMKAVLCAINRVEMGKKGNL